ncbi:basal cell adhesion molecule-like [Lethenteron reissneri]|uniref:basal cell adhesion molecule-like n=1 Tax=Lethenteron reissneri TaxID=7753 RepID=UPI002AB73EAC|nr:basal cell adhesion molecule-like [Lethenteron reissneri]
MICDGEWHRESMPAVVGCVDTPRGRVALILESHREAAVKEGDTVVLRCRADGFPPPEIDFYRSSPTRVDYGHAAAGNALTLPAVSRDHSGTYGCRVRGGRDPPDSSVDLLVHYADDVKPLGPTEATRLTAGDVVQVASAAASSSSSPAGIPTLTWTQAGTALSGGATLTLRSATPSKMGATSPPSVPGLGRSRPVKVAVGGHRGGGAEEAEASGRGLPWLIIILNLLLVVVPPLFLVFCVWALRHVCSREPREVAVVASERRR